MNYKSKGIIEGSPCSMSSLQQQQQRRRDEILMSTTTDRVLRLEAELKSTRNLNKKLISEVAAARSNNKFFGGSELSLLQHGIHLCLFFSWILWYQYTSGGWWYLRQDHVRSPNTFEMEGLVFGTALWIVKLCMLLSGAVIHILIFLGLVFCNQFPDPVQLNPSPSSAPFISIRIVTRGLYPEFVRRNVERNVQTCHDAGFHNFLIEVVTDNPQNLPSYSTDGRVARIREILVPETYQTKTGALYKARALQYCWEDGVNELDDKDYVVHLDEETLLQESSVRGILNFCTEGTYDIGHGAVTYGNGTVVNWFTTLVDNFRVAQDAAFQFLFTYVHRPLLTMKGSFVVTKAGVERKVSFDFGPEGSITEDGFFALTAYRMGYKFGHIEGEMWEQSTYNLMDFVRQVKRWFQGQHLLAFASGRHIPLRYRIIQILGQLGCTFCPLHWFFRIFGVNIPYSTGTTFIDGFCAAVYTYSVMFGGLRNFRHKFRGQPLRFLLSFLAAYLLRPVSETLKNIAVLWGFFTPKIRFHIIQKGTKSKQQKGILTKLDAEKSRSKTTTSSALKKLTPQINGRGNAAQKRKESQKEKPNMGWSGIRRN